MRFKMFLLVGFSVAVLLILVSCAAPTSETSSHLIQEGLSSLNSGNTDEAKDYFAKVLKSDPENPEANAGMGVILTFETVQNVSNFLLESFYQINPFITNIPMMRNLMRAKGFGLSNPLLFSFAKFAVDKLMSLSREIPTKQLNGTNYEEFLETLRSLQAILSDAEKYLRKAIERGVSFNLYVNALDWDGDETPEPYKPLKLTDGTNTYEFYKILLGMVIPTFESTPCIDKNGGDAWFDFEGLSAILVGNIPPSNVSFTDSDYIFIDEGELTIVLSLVEFLKAGVDLLLIWNFTIPENLPMPAMYEDPYDWQLAVIQYIDKNNDGKVDNDSNDGGEWNALDPLLTFNTNGESYLIDFVKSVKGLAWAILQLDNDVENDPDDIHDLTSGYYVTDIIDQQMEAELSELVNDGTITYSYEGTNIVISLNVLEEHPERFDDLKKYFPTLQWDETADNFIPTYWPDPTFGGLINVNY